jgi:ribosomal-protein-alanine N-acetyltransferase
MILDGMRQSAAEFVIRAAEESDLEAIFALECASFVGDRLSRRALRRFLKGGRHPLLVARSSGRVIGYALVSLPPRARAARLYSIAIAAAHRRRGVGRELLHAAERYARAHGRAALRLEVRYDNAPAIALYEKQGYRHFGRCPEYYEDGAEALRFEKALAE